MNTPRLDIIDGWAKEDVDAEVLQSVLGILGEFWVEGCEQAVASFDEDDIEVSGVDVSVVCADGATDEVRKGTCEFDSGGPSSDHDDGHKTSSFGRVFGDLGAFKGFENTSADLQGIRERLEADGVLGPLVFAVEGGTCSAGEDEVVEGVFIVCRGRDFGGGIDSYDGVQKHLHVLGFGKNAAQGAGNVWRCQRGGGHLIEKGLKKVVILFVDKGHLKSSVVGEFLGAGETGETSTDNKNVFGSGHGLMLVQNF